MRRLLLATAVALAAAPLGAASADPVCAHAVVTTPPTDDLMLLTSCLPSPFITGCSTFADYTPRGFGYAVTVCLPLR